MKYATIGTSWITESYIAAAAHTGKWELEAVFSRNEATAAYFAEKHNAKKYYTDLCLLAADEEVKAVYIASPNSLHYTQSKQMLLAGKHVICEKPATVTSEQFEELTALAKEKSLIFMEAIMSMHVPALKTLKEKIKEIGRISSVHIDYCQLSSKYPALLQGNIPNIFNPELCTGALMDLGVYNLYLIAELFGKPNAILSASKFLHTKADHTTSAVFDYDDFQLTFTCSKIGQGFSQSEIIGDSGTIGIDSVSQLTGITVRKAKSDHIDIIVPFEQDKTEIMSHEALAFYNYIQHNIQDEDLKHLHDTALLVRNLCDSIRKQNKFIF